MQETLFLLVNGSLVEGASDEGKLLVSLVAGRPFWPGWPSSSQMATIFPNIGSFPK
jgi:hypothetical protein